MRFAQKLEIRNSNSGFAPKAFRSTANSKSFQLIVLGYAVKTLESKETKASKEITVTHNSVFAAHRLQCRMTTRKIDIRHFVVRFRNEEQRKRYFSIRETCPAASCQRPLRLINVSVNCTTRSNDLPSAVPFTRVFPRTIAVSLP